MERLAREKAEAVTASPDDVVVAADTTVAFAGQILGKPVDAADARRMLLLLSDQTHDVHTGVAVRTADRTATRVVTTNVTMVTISEADIAWYVGTGEPLDKAGAYALQGAGGVLVRSVEGSSSNVVGLPLAELAELLAAAGWPLDRLRHRTARLTAPDLRVLVGKLPLPAAISRPERQRGAPATAGAGPGRGPRRRQTPTGTRSDRRWRSSSPSRR